MSRFYPLQVADIRKETADCVSVAVAVPVDLKAIFAFLPGQYLTFRLFAGDEEIRRSYSICSSPREGEWRVAVKRIANGRFSDYVHDQLKPGDILEVMPPMGNFIHRPEPGKAGFYAAFAAGSGITPVISIVKSVLEEEPLSRIVLFYGNKNTENIILREEIEGLKNKYLNRLSVYYILSREHTGSELFTGRIDENKCERFFQLIIDPHMLDEAFLCGPFEMIQTVKKLLEQHGMDPKKIHHELFVAGTRPPDKKEDQKTEPAIESLITVRIDGMTLSFPLNSKGESILEASLRAGADLPFSCKGGVCSTCRAKLTEGVVEMEVNWALEPEEVAEGYVLTCQSHPRTKKVTVDFDI